MMNSHLFGGGCQEDWQPWQHGSLLMLFHPLIMQDVATSWSLLTIKYWPDRTWRTWFYNDVDASPHQQNHGTLLHELLRRTLHHRLLPHRQLLNSHGREFGIRIHKKELLTNTLIFRVTEFSDTDTSFSPESKGLPLAPPAPMDKNKPLV